MLKQPLVLIVDDEEYIREIIKIKLEANGIEVKEAGNGSEGLILAVRYIPNVILLDLIMPIMGGVETLAKLQANEKTKDIKVFLFTGKGDPRPDITEMSKKFAIDSGAVDFIRKETDLNDILKEIQKYI